MTRRSAPDVLVILSKCVYFIHMSDTRGLKECDIYPNTKYMSEALQTFHEAKSEGGR